MLIEIRAPDPADHVHANHPPEHPSRPKGPQKAGCYTAGKGVGFDREITPSRGHYCGRFYILVDGRVTAALGVLVVVLEGLQQLNQWQHNWITYRSTCEALRHEKYSYLGRSGPYDGLNETEAKKSLVERVEALISTEHSKWIAYQESEIAKEKARLAASQASKESGNG